MLGALFVVSAGLARNYDGEDLIHEPWHLLMPFAASLGTATVLFLMWKTICALAKARLPWRAFLPFLGIYWLTAPLAWLYGIPYEQWLPVEDAIGANVRTLMVVAIWRVIIMTRVIQLGVRSHPIPTFIIDVWYGIALIIAASFFSPRPILDMMGGMRGDPEVHAWSRATLSAQLLGLPIAMVLGVIALLVAVSIKPKGMRYMPRVFGSTSGSYFAPITWAGVIAIGIWIIPMLAMQPQQRLRSKTEALIRQGDHTAALRMMSQHEQDDYPRHWKPARNWNLWRGGVSRLDDLSAINLLESADVLFTKEPPREWVKKLILNYARTGLTRDHRFTWHENFDDIDVPWAAIKEIRTNLTFLIKYDDAMTSEDREKILRLIDRINAEIALPTKR